MFRRIGTVITLIFVFSVGQVVLALNASGRATTYEATVTQDNQNRREGRRNDLSRQRGIKEDIAAYQPGSSGSISLCSGTSATRNPIRDHSPSPSTWLI